LSRLPAHVEVASLMRRAEQAGDFATILKKGDPDRGSLLIVVNSRGSNVAILERVLSLDGDYQWRPVTTDSADPSKVAELLAKRARFDEDLWAIELDVADPERFIAETKLTG
jgi:hypothetical protein